jgi:hypothetical protein
MRDILPLGERLIPLFFKCSFCGHSLPEVIPTQGKTNAIGILTYFTRTIYISYANRSFIQENAIQPETGSIIFTFSFETETREIHLSQIKPSLLSSGREGFLDKVNLKDVEYRRDGCRRSSVAGVIDSYEGEGVFSIDGIVEDGLTGTGYRESDLASVWGMQGTLRGTREVSDCHMFYFLNPSGEW